MPKSTSNTSAGAGVSGFIIPVLTAIAAAGATALINRYSESKELSTTKAQLEALTTKYVTLNTNYANLNSNLIAYTQKGVWTNRPISFQLERLREHIAETDTKDEKRQHTHTVAILGINALGPISQGKRILADLLRHGSHIQLLLLDPESKAWTERLAQENDVLNYNAAELLAALYDLSEIKNRVPVSSHGTLEIRMYAEKPDRSLIVVDRQFVDGFVMGNRYPPAARKGEEGVEGESYIEPINTERGKEELDRFDGLWRLAVPRNLPSQPFSWPYKR